MARKRAAAKAKPAPTAQRALLRPWHMVVLAFTLAVGGGAWWAWTAHRGDSEPASVAEIKELLVTTAQQAALSRESAGAMLEQIRSTPGGEKVNPKVIQIIPAEVDAFYAEAMSKPGGLGDELVPLFAKRFTSAEIAQLLAFYRSPLYKKLNDEMPKIAAQSAPLAQQWTYDHWPELSRRVEAALKREGIALPQRPAGDAPVLVKP